MSLTLGTETLPDNSSQEYEFDVAGATIILADGSVAQDNIAATANRIITLGWKSISKTDMLNVVDALNYSMSNASITFTDINSDSFTVDVIRNSLRVVQTIRTGSNSRYDVSVKLRTIIS